jgi:uncharacterized membrane protein
VGNHEPHSAQALSAWTACPEPVEGASPPTASGRALQLGPASRVAPLDKLSVPLVIVFAWLLLGEKLTAPALIGGLLITAGAVVIALR